MGERLGSLEDLGMNEFWGGKRVLVTGHTGFKGSWLSLWLTEFGATVHGLALPPATTPALFDQLDLASSVDHFVGDVRNAKLVADRIGRVEPDVIFHLAAQPLVRRSYAEPLQTWETNVMGTVHVLEALRSLDNLCAVVVITTDKVYQNREWLHAYRETDRLGGHDPYSSSKSAAELAVGSWRSSFFTDSSGIRVASARAGNVIGGGDWAADRVVPDLVRALTAGEPVQVRNPGSVRPWQHVLEPLSGYLLLAEHLYLSSSVLLQDAFNFGPGVDGFRSVGDLVAECLRWWPGEWEASGAVGGPHEAGLLALATEKAHSLLGWQPRLSFAEGVKQTISWYALDRSSIRDACLHQIKGYGLLTGS
ncbi:MAG: CDP-glucose 4,6-dehydratase [Nitrospira sp.]|nr:CDP-glucose 4,6-dehydratase [Nitrospira sp.]